MSEPRIITPDEAKEELDYVRQLTGPSGDMGDWAYTVATEPERFASLEDGMRRDLESIYGERIRELECEIEELKRAAAYAQSEILVEYAAALEGNISASQGSWTHRDYVNDVRDYAGEVYP